MIQLSYFSIVSYCLFIYSSNAASNLGHIFVLLPGFYFTFKFIKLGLPKSAYFLLAFIAIAILSIFASDSISDKMKSVGELRYFLAGIISIWAFTATFAKKISQKQIRFLLHATIIIASVASINGIIGLFTGFNPLKLSPSTDPNRATGLYSMAITYGYGIQFITLILAGLLIYRKKVTQWISTKVLLFGFVACFLGLIYSGSRGALLGFYLGLPFIFYRSNKTKFIRILGALIAILTATVIIIFSGGSHYTRFLLPAKHDSNMIRVSQYQAAFEAIKEHPWIGHGYRNFGNVSERIKIEHDIPFKDFISHAHNNYVEFWADTGFFGFLFFILFHIAWSLEALRRKDYIGDITLSVSIAFFVSGMFQCTIIDAENAFAIMFIYGLSQVTHQRIKALNSLLSL